MFDYYHVLDVNRNVSDEELKKIYKKLVMRWHPDKNLTDKAEAERKFKEITEAYDVLSDPSKRAIYDKYGADGLNGQNEDPSNRSDDDIFADFFGTDNFDFGYSCAKSTRFPSYGGDPPKRSDSKFSSFDEDLGSWSTKQVPKKDEFTPSGKKREDVESTKKSPPKTEPVASKLPCSLEELYTGSTRKMRISRRVIDTITGVSKTELDRIVINVKAGWKEGTKITFLGKGNEDENKIRQDLIFVISEKPHDTYKRDGNDLLVNLKIPLVDALAGTQIALESLDGKDILIPIDDMIIESGHEIEIEDEGMPIPKEPGKKGNLRVKFEVAFPKQLTKAQKERIRKAFQNVV